MPELIDEKTRKELEGVLAKLPNPITLVFFTEEKECPACKQQRKILAELVALSDQLILKVYDRDRDAAEAKRYAIDKTPATAVIGEKDHGIRFYGLTAGYEFQSLIETILMVATENSNLSPEFRDMVARIDQPIHLEVMTTLTCPYCPNAVHAAQQLAMINDYIRADMVESTAFPELAQRYDVTNTPKTMINETHSFVGAIPVERVYLEILKAVNPDEYQRIESAIREAHGHRHVRKAEPKHEYDMIIVGGGTAAMSAAIYAARKALDVLIIAKSLGGQITYTALVENYLGLPNIDGKDMVEQFIVHMEQFPIAEALGADVIEITGQERRFLVRSAAQQEFYGKSIVYCAGKEYRKLGVPGEERFMGRGIAFCATCDAPLYKGKRVAVVGGGNSAFTAARDLLVFAQEIHLIHRRETFRADPALIKEIQGADNVTIHTSSVVKEILGDKKLTGIRLQSKNKKTQDLTIDGVFLEIGLLPNTSPVASLVRLNERGEIIINKENASSIPGLYAAGDVTDVPQKQIIIAAGEGAKAALSAYDYLVENGLVSRKAVQDSWQQ